MGFYNKVCYFLASGFGIGRINNIPTGTVASILAVPIWWMLMFFFSYQIYIIFLFFMIGFGIYICNKANQIIHIHDHKSIVWDEFVGMWVTLIIVPIYDCLLIFVAFFLFRLLDIMKPWPISWCNNKLRNGFGIVVDDFLASLGSIGIIYILKFVFYFF